MKNYRNITVRLSLCLLISLLAQSGKSAAIHSRFPAEGKAQQDSLKASPIIIKNEKVNKNLATANPNDKPVILDIIVENLSVSPQRTSQIRPNDDVSVVLLRPKELLKQRPNDKSNLILYANGLPLTGIRTPYFNSVGKYENNTDAINWLDTLRIPFVFSRDSSTKEAWNCLFRFAKWNQNKISVRLSMGWEGMFPLKNVIKSDKGAVRETNIVFYDEKTFWSLLAGYTVLIAFFVYLSLTTGLIRDPDTVGTGQLGAFSLGQTQLAFWTVLIVGGFLYLVLLTGLSDSLNDSCLILLGISGGTTGIANFIDFAKRRSNVNANAAAQLPAVNPYVKKHVSFIHDILSDGQNISVQRTQIAVWNLVLGGYFVWYILANRAMPVFNSTLLLLALGSSALYLVSKGPEK